MRSILIILGSTALLLGCAAVNSRRIAVTENSPHGSFITTAMILPDGTFSNRVTCGGTNRILCGVLGSQDGEEFAVDLRYACQSPNRDRSFHTRLSLLPLQPVAVCATTGTVQDGSSPSVADWFRCVVELE